MTVSQQQSYTTESTTSCLRREVIRFTQHEGDAVTLISKWISGCEFTIRECLSNIVLHFQYVLIVDLGGIHELTLVGAARQLTEEVHEIEETGGTPAHRRRACEKQNLKKLTLTQRTTYTIWNEKILTDLKGQSTLCVQKFRQGMIMPFPSISCASLVNVITAVHTETGTEGAAGDSLWECATGQHHSKGFGFHSHIQDKAPVCKHRKDDITLVEYFHSVK